MTAQELRRKYVDFFKERGHSEIASASLLPDNDPTVLFTTAGMHPLVPYLLGETHPQGKRLTSVQKCIRTSDIDEVGDDTHLTFFEMLGNWSLGDYYKEESISLSFEFLTTVLHIPLERLAVTVFSGDDMFAKDYETAEIWNNVFMEYNKNSDGSFEALKNKNVDTGMGMERVLTILNGKDNVYDTELFLPLMNKLKSSTNISYSDKNIRDFRIICEHSRAITFILGDPKRIIPSNTEQGYILRRLIRRAIRLIRKIEVSDSVLCDLSKLIIEQYKDVYKELEENQSFILEQIEGEVNLFKKLLIQD